MCLDVRICGLVAVRLNVQVEMTYRPQLGGFLANRAGNGGALHLTLGVDDLSDAS